jgi:hypothetical protein
MKEGYLHALNGMVTHRQPSQLTSQLSWVWTKL